MSTQIKRRGGPTAEHATFAGAERELTVDTDKKTVVVHDGVTLGGYPLAHESHLHPLTDIGSGSGVIEVSEGGTGSNNALGALSALGAAAEDHTHEALTGFGDTIFVDTNEDFQVAYSGSPKTIVLGGGVYSLPNEFIPGINLVRLGGFDDTRLNGDMTISASSVGRTTWQGFHLHGNLITTPTFNGALDLNFVHQSLGRITLDSPEGEIHITRGSIDSFSVLDGDFEVFGAHIIGAGSSQDGGMVSLVSVDIKVDSIDDVLTLNNGELRIVNTNYENPTGNGFVLNQGVAIIDGLYLTGASGGDALVIGNNVVLTLGSHNLGPVGGDNILQFGGTVVPMSQLLEDNSVGSATLKYDTVTGAHMVDLAINTNKLSVNARTSEFSGVIPRVLPNERIVIMPYTSIRGVFRGLRIQSLDQTTVTVPVTIEKHEVRGEGEPFSASSIVVASTINVSQNLHIERNIDENLVQGEAISINFGAISGSASLDNVAWSIVFTSGSL